MTERERETLGQMLELLGEFRKEFKEEVGGFRSEVKAEFRGVKDRLRSLEDERTTRVAVDDALKIERRRVSDGWKWRLGVVMGALTGLGGLIVSVFAK